MSDIEFEKYLKDDEHILWSHIPEERKFYLRNGIFVIIGAILILGGVGMMLKSTEHRAWYAIIFGAIVVFSYIDHPKAYLLTDKRILVIKDLLVKKVSYYNVSYITVNKKKNSDIGTVVACFINFSGRRNIHFRYREDCVKLYDIPDCEKAADIIKKLKGVPGAYEKAREAERMQGF